MILKNKALLIFDFLASPTERLYERAARFHLKSLIDTLEGRAVMDSQKAAVFQYFPEVAAALGAKALQNEAIAQAIRKEPMAALRLLLTDYKALAPALEAVVLSSGEATYYLLKHAAEQKIALNLPQHVYHNTLLNDPFWALRLYGDTQDESLLARCLQLGQNQKDTSAGAAYVHLYFTPGADPTDFVETLSSSAMYAYLASRHFYDRGIEFKYFSIKGLTPRWAYHFITDGFLDDEEGLIDTMLASPDWLVEYLVESERYKDLPYIAPIYDRAMKKAATNPQSIYLKLWWERVQTHVKKTTPPAKKPEAAATQEEKK